LRDVGDGPEQISSREEIEAVKRLARQVNVSALVTAIVATAPFVLLR
jgi:hypothetical protein